ncbi:LOW QUALITY PROTEIN: GTPase-activating protein and VPS9 domain-containing protein 1-like [Brienomyrus brachyistius]|uniref:LOW QUALITY PROTEIN: GTPase-activating protein and VPS9 domain-containing protein 1-like n=1 Tax=Brienomyrus brachyistius TaxID=42636 RepID=UPI0020B21FFB|nr:LOW QUALITY PROTEIN: GTPase-activating protein and VPS9 domain-containing protein 1-like [Brienomyrus brachyistius]
MATLDVHTLAHHLKQERLYVASEKQLIQRLNADVLKAAEMLYCTTWVAGEQRNNLDRIIRTSTEASPTECCQRARLLEDTRFVDGYTALGHQVVACGELLAGLRSDPRLVASCLEAGQWLSPERTLSAAHTVFASLYGSCVTQEDEGYLFKVLCRLAELELPGSEPPPRPLGHGGLFSGTFTLIFQLLSQGLFASQLFLTAALHGPIMQLLVEDEDPLETDPAKVGERPARRVQAQRPGTPAERAWAAAKANAAKLAALAERFVGGLRSSTYCFPRGLCWALAQVRRLLLARMEPAAARAVCANLLLTCFVCPAVINPEQYGIVCDAPINEAARFNLTQVSQLLQQLATEEPSKADPGRKSVQPKLDKSGIADFLDAVIGEMTEQAPPTASRDPLEGLTKMAVYITQNQLHALVELLHDLILGGHLQAEEQQKLQALLVNVPLPPSPTPRESRDSMELLPPTVVTANKKHSLPLGSALSRSTMALDADLEAASQESTLEAGPEEVLVISLGNTPRTLPGMMSESDVLVLEGGGGALTAEDPDGSGSHRDLATSRRFSCCHDNAEEAASEGASEAASEARSNSDSSVDLEVESGPGAAGLSESCEVEALLLMKREQARYCLDVCDTWSTDALASDFDPGLDEDRLQEVAGASAEPQQASLNLFSSFGSCSSSMLAESFAGSTISEAASDAWSVEVLSGDQEALDVKPHELMQEVESDVLDDVMQVTSHPSSPGKGMGSDMSAAPAEDALSESSSDGKDSVAGPDGGGPGCASPQQSPSDREGVLFTVDHPGSEEGTAPCAVVRPKGQNARAAHPPSFPAAFPLPGLRSAELEHVKQRLSLPEQLGRVCVDDPSGHGRRPVSDPGVHRRVMLEDRQHPATKGEAEEKKDSDDERPDRSRPWWKKRLASALPKGSKSAFRKKDRSDKQATRSNRVQPGESPPGLAEDILDKYRNIKRNGSAAPVLVGGEAEAELAVETERREDMPIEEASSSVVTDNRPEPYPNGDCAPRYQFSLRDAKKKLRLALSSADALIFPIMLPAPIPNELLDNVHREENEVVCFLKVQLAEAINLQDKKQMAQIQETLRCVGHISADQCQELLAAVANDYRQRAPYVAYLTRCRQGLQATRAHLERQLRRVLRAKELTSRCFTAACVRVLLNRMEDKMMNFTTVFQGFTAADDKTAAVEDFLQHLYGLMAQDAIWQFASEEQLQDAQVAIERSVMNHIFKMAFYPNLDGDTLRDQVLHEHIERLSKVVTANHKALQIPQVYLKEAPWPAAQAEIGAMSAYRTPRDKVQCVLRMCTSIMNLLSLANEDAVPGADDFLPVLVFVLIKANPLCLLSTIQYISNFYSSRLSGEESYWWMQFTAAVEFIKTIDDRK